ncbi:hypothetical protein [Cytobacillus pseudoceanisediminis]
MDIQLPAFSKWVLSYTIIYMQDRGQSMTSYHNFHVNNGGEAAESENRP